EREAVLANVSDLWTEIEQQRFDTFERFGPAADHDGELSLLNRDHASRYGCIDHICALLANLSCQLASHRRADGAIVHPNLTRSESCENSVGSIRRLRYGLGIPEHRKGEVGRSGDGAGRVRPFHAFVDEPLGL